MGPAQCPADPLPPGLRLRPSSLQAALPLRPPLRLLPTYPLAAGNPQAPQMLCPCSRAWYVHPDAHTTTATWDGKVFVG